MGGRGECKCGFGNSLWIMGLGKEGGGLRACQSERERELLLLLL